MPSLLTLHVADDPDLWAQLGFNVSAGRVRIASTDIVLSAPTDGQPCGIVAWTLDLADAPTAIDGLATRSKTDAHLPLDIPLPTHPNGTTGIDHLVVSTPDLERTVAVLEGLGMTCLRRRDGTAYGSQKMRQAFFWLEDAEVVPPDRVQLEVVGPAEPDPYKTDQPAVFFGLALVSTDLDATCNFYGDLMKPPTNAVQPGRQITVLSSRSGCKVALAFMSPHSNLRE